MLIFLYGIDWLKMKYHYQLIQIEDEKMASLYRSKEIIKDTEYASSSPSVDSKDNSWIFADFYLKSIRGDVYMSNYYSW